MGEHEEDVILIKHTIFSKNSKQPRRKKSQDEDDKMKRRDEDRKMNETYGTETRMKDNKTSRRVENEGRQENIIGN